MQHRVTRPTPATLVLYGASLVFIALAAAQVIVFPEPGVVQAIQVFIPATFGLGLLALTSYVHRRLPVADAHTGARYAIGLGLTGAAIYVLIVVTIHFDGGDPYDPQFVGLSVLTISTLVGASLGVLRESLAKSRADLHTELERTRLLNQHLAVINRILRHNVRNRLTVALGYLEQARTDLAGDQVDSHLDHVEAALDSLLANTEKSLAFQKAGLEVNAAREPIDLVPLTTQVITAFDASPYDGRIQTSLPTEAAALVHPALDLAIAEAIENVLQHTDTDVTVTIDVTKNEETITLTVADDGSGIEAAEIEALGLAAETPLQHTSGVGLWLIRWVTDLSGGSLSIGEATPTGTILSMTLPRAPDGAEGQSNGVDPD